MAEDDNNPDTGNRSAGPAEGNSAPKTVNDYADNVDRGRRDIFVETDDGSATPFVNRDYENDLPGSDEEPEDSDPGYAAFASELEDPLADWPSPEASLDDLPELRQPNVTDQTGDQIDPPAEDLLFSDGGDRTDNNIDKRVYEDAVDIDRFAGGAFNEYQGELDNLQTLANNAPGDFPESLAADTSQPKLPYSDDLEAVPADAVDPLSTGASDKPFTAQEDAFEDEDGFDQEFDDEFVDDFLNDLDPPSAFENNDEGEDEGDEPDFDAPDLATLAMVSSSVERAGRYNEDAIPGVDPEPDHTRPRPDSDGPNDDMLEVDEGRSLPVGMLAVVLVALILLGIGGYGVVQQRSEMQAEIRELQARLATTITPEEAEAEREIQRQIQLENESLSAELEALTAENSGLVSQLASLEEDLDVRARAQAQKLAKAEADAQAAAEQEARRAAANAAQTGPVTTSTAAGSLSSNGLWFVNFGSYANQNIAQRWADKLSVDDGKVVVQSASAAGKTLYRVRVIDLTSQDAAERVATALERQYELPRLWVGKR